MAGFCESEYGCLGSLTVDGFPMNCPGWDLYGFQPVWSQIEVRGDEVVLPTAPGRRSYPSRRDQIEFEMTLYVTGEANQAGVAHGDPWVGLYDNLQTLKNNAFDAVPTGDGLRPAVLTLPDGVTTLSARIKFDGLRASQEIENPRFAVFRTSMIVPSGAFV